jgi:hypothetical protein
MKFFVYSNIGRMWRQKQAEMNGQGQGPSGYFSADASSFAHNIAKNMAENVAGNFAGNLSGLYPFVITPFICIPLNSNSYRLFFYLYTFLSLFGPFSYTF